MLIEDENEYENKFEDDAVDKEEVLMPLFTEIDYAIVRRAIRKLPKIQRNVLYLHFWGRHSLTEISYAFRLPWHIVNRLYENALVELHQQCLGNRRFSRRCAVASKIAA